LKAAALTRERSGSFHAGDLNEEASLSWQILQRWRTALAIMHLDRCKRLTP
jgi:hypothetical protein